MKTALSPIRYKTHPVQPFTYYKANPRQHQTASNAIPRFGATVEFLAAVGVIAGSVGVGYMFSRLKHPSLKEKAEMKNNLQRLSVHQQMQMIHEGLRDPKRGIKGRRLMAAMIGELPLPDAKRAVLVQVGLKSPDEEIRRLSTKAIDQIQDTNLKRKLHENARLIHKQHPWMSA